MSYHTELEHLTELMTSLDGFNLPAIFISLQRLCVHLRVWNVIKLDRSILPEDKEDIDHSNQILSHIIAMAKDIGMNCVAEGVETKKQLNTLHQYGCHIVQGFLFD